MTKDGKVQQSLILSHMKYSIKMYLLVKEDETTKVLEEKEKKNDF